MCGSKLKVLYIAGWGRSGSTILGNILGMYEGFFHGGELYYIWDRGILENQPVGTGELFSDCRFWQEILVDAFGGAKSADAQTALRHRDRVRTRHFYETLTRGGRRNLQRRSTTLGKKVQKLYEAIQSATDCRVIVDSSKYPMYGYLLGSLDDVETHVVHLVRDPRATAYSWMRKKKAAESAAGDRTLYMAKHNSIRSTVFGDAMNLATEVATQRVADTYTQLRYEDFVAHPRSATERIIETIGEQTVSSPFLSENEVRIEPGCTVSGNPVRFRRGPVALTMDDEWKSRMTRRHRAVVTTLAWPWLMRYGYL